MGPEVGEHNAPDLDTAAPMHDRYVNATPNGFKEKRELEEATVDHRCVRVRLAAAEHSAPSFLGISPNNKVA